MISSRVVYFGTSHSLARFLYLTFETLAAQTHFYEHHLDFKQGKKNSSSRDKIGGIVDYGPASFLLIHFRPMFHLCRNQLVGFY